MDIQNLTPGRTYTVNVLAAPVAVAAVKSDGTAETLTTWEETGPHEIRALTSALRFEGGAIGLWKENIPGFNDAALTVAGGGVSREQLNAALAARVGGMSATGDNLHVPGGMAVDGPIDAAAGVVLPDGTGRDLAMNFVSLEAMRLKNWMANALNSFSRYHIESELIDLFYKSILAPSEKIGVINSTKTYSRAIIAGAKWESSENNVCATRKKDNDLASVFFNHGFLANTCVQTNVRGSHYIGFSDLFARGFSYDEIAHSIHWNPYPLNNHRYRYLAPQNDGVRKRNEFAYTVYSPSYLAPLWPDGNTPVLVRVSHNGNEGQADYDWYVTPNGNISKLTFTDIDLYNSSTRGIYCALFSGLRLLGVFYVGMFKVGTSWGHAQRMRGIDESYVERGDTICSFSAYTCCGTSSEECFAPVRLLVNEALTTHTDATPHAVADIESVPAAGGTFNVTITTDGRAAYVINDTMGETTPWCQQSTTRTNSRSSVVTMTVLPNESAQQRELWFFIGYEYGKCSIIKLTQEGLTI